MAFNNPPRLSISYEIYPSTVVFTVTNKHPNAIIYRILSYLTQLFRVIIILCVVSLYYPLFWPDVPVPSSTPVLLYPVLKCLYKIVETIGRKGVSEVTFYTLLVTFMVNISPYERYTQEKLTVRGGILLMFSTEKFGWLGCTRATNCRTVFLSHIQDILIHEGYVGFKKKLVIAVSGEDEMIVAFPTLLPDIKILELVGREARKHIDRGTGINGDVLENDGNGSDDEQE